jgi:hypothetical protein
MEVEVGQGCDPGLAMLRETAATKNADLIGQALPDVHFCFFSIYDYHGECLSIANAIRYVMI